MNPTGGCDPGAPGMGPAQERQARRPSGGPTTVLLFSNGHGEDAVGACIARRLQEAAPHIRVWAAPIVGEGLAYRRAGVPVVVPTGVLPSGGFRTLARPASVWMDLRAGMLRLHWRQAMGLRRLRHHIHLVVAVGDRVGLQVSAWLVRRPVVHVAISDSTLLWEDGRTDPGERRLMLRCRARVFTRDEPTARVLRSLGVRAEFVGNPMMDTLEPGGRPLPVELRADEIPVALLPGSRPEAYRNFTVILDAVAHLAAEGPPGLRFLAAWPEHLPVDGLATALAGSSWRMSGQAGPGRDGQEGQQRWDLELQASHRATVHLVRGCFADILHRARVVIGMAGTANEQAAGLGKPVIACPGFGPQVTEGLMRRQVRLLGEAVRPVRPVGAAIAEAVREVLADAALYRRMSEAGRARMGPPGAARRIAEAVVEELNSTAAGPPVGWAPVGG